MADDKSKTGKPDDLRINVNQAYEVTYWCGQLGCTEQQLRNAVAAVGPMVADVKRHLGR